MGYKNFYVTKLFTDIGAADATITLETPPSTTSGRLVLEARNPTQREIIKYTGVSGSDITGVTRGQGGTSAKAHVKNSLVEMNMTAEDIDDLYAAFASFAPGASSGWTLAVDEPNTVVHNGNRSYNLTFNGVDLTSLYSAGMRQRYARTVAAPTKCTDLEASSSQYFSRASGSLAGITFTDDFTVSAWVKLESYPASQFGVVSRFNGTSGWALRIETTGQVQLVGFNAGAGNRSEVISNQAIPLGRWIHIAAQLDMSAFTATPTTSYVMIDGLDVPASVSRIGTNPTALVQAGDLQIGATNAVLFFDGKVAQAALYNAKVTQATIRAAMNQTLVGNETNLISAYSFNNSIVDLNANANNLTANGGAVATNADSPYAQGAAAGSLEYGIIMAVSFSTDTTLTVQVPEGSTIPTSGGVGVVDYSPHKAPYGFPIATNKWELLTLSLIDRATSSATYVSLVESLLIPIGAWKLTLNASFRLLSPASTTTRHGYLTLSSDATTETNPNITCTSSVKSSAAAQAANAYRTAGTDEVVVAAATTFTLMGKVSNADASANVDGFTTLQATRLRALCAYL